MLLFSQITKISRSSIALLAVLFLSACQFQPLHGDRSANQGGAFQNLSVGSVSSRVGQQVRNHLLFLFNGGFDTGEKKTHEVKLLVTFNNRLSASLPDEEDSTAGTVTVRVSYEIIELSTSETVAKGFRSAAAAYDRTGQVFANNRATRDAENRAAKEAAEAIRLAVAADLSRI